VKKLCIMISPSLSQPRYHKRCRQLLEAGCEVNVFSFERQYYNFNGFPEEAKFFNIGKVRDGHYFERVFTLLRAYLSIFVKTFFSRKAKNVFVYTFEFDCFILGKLLFFKNMISEVGDLRDSILSNFILNLTKRFSNKVILTSQGFVDFLTSKSLSYKDKFGVIENKLDKSFLNINRIQKENSATLPIKVGVIGLLRYETPLKLILDIAARHYETIKIICYGDGPFRNLFEDSDLSNVEYHGPFNAAKDLPRIYSQIDINYVVYDNSSENVRLALPNKLYESMFFQVPIICANNTFLEKKVIEHGIGISVDTNHKNNFDRDILAITPERIREFRSNCWNIKNSTMIDDGSDIIRDVIGAFS
jgi:succinoglycan biosynthesis protein ExoL